MPGIAIFPFRVDICGINEISIVLGLGVEYREGLRLISAPAKDISAKAQWVDFQVSFIQCNMGHTEKFMALY